MAKATRKYTDSGYTDALVDEVSDLRYTLRELHKEIAGGHPEVHHAAADVLAAASALDLLATTIDTMNGGQYEEVGRMVGNVDQKMPTGL